MIRRSLCAVAVAAENSLCLAYDICSIELQSYSMLCSIWTNGPARCMLCLPLVIHHNAKCDDSTDLPIVVTCTALRQCELWLCLCEPRAISCSPARQSQRHQQNDGVHGHKRQQLLLQRECDEWLLVLKVHIVNTATIVAALRYTFPKGPLVGSRLGLSSILHQWHSNAIQGYARIVSCQSVHVSQA